MRHTILALAVAGALLAACADSTSPRAHAGEPRPGAAFDNQVVFASAGGLHLSSAAAHQVQRRVVQSLAAALGDAALRQRIHARLAASLMPEQKLHFRDLVQDHALGLGQAMARAFHGAEPQLEAALDSLIDFELYLPVPAHRQQWAGGPSLIVASMLDEDENPVAFDLDGHRLADLSRKAPPGTPVLVLAPVEQSFAGPAGGPALATCGDDCQPPCQGDSCGGTAGGGDGDVGSVPGGILRLAGIKIDDDHEPWMSGDPEFEVWVWAAAPDGSPLLKQIQHPDVDFYSLVDAAVAADCIGQYFPKSSDKYWDLNSEAWWTAAYPQPVIFRNTDPLKNAQFRWDIVVVENDDPGRCPERLPTIGNPNLLANDDDLVGRMTLPGGLGPLDASGFGDVGRIVLRYGN